MLKIFLVQEQVEEMKKKEEWMEKQMNEVMAENKRLVEPLQKAKSEVEELSRQLANYEKDKQSLAVSTVLHYCKTIELHEPWSWNAHGMVIASLPNYIVTVYSKLQLI